MDVLPYTLWSRINQKVRTVLSLVLERDPIPIRPVTVSCLLKASARHGTRFRLDSSILGANNGADKNGHDRTVSLF